MPALITLCLLLVAAPAAAGTARCEVDLEAGSFAWTAPDGRPLDPVHLPDAAELFAELSAALAAGDGADSLRARIGRAVLSPVWPRISTADAWRITPVGGRELPGHLDVLAVVALPDGRAALESVNVSLDWPGAGPPSGAGKGDRGGALLLSAPFTADVDPATDDPDTLRHALAKAARTVRLIPRNETGDGTLQRALEEIRPSLWWFRGEPDALAALAPAFGNLPDVVVWTLPSRSSLTTPAFDPATFGGDHGASCLIVATRPVAESALAPMARNFVDGLARGLDCATALRDAQIGALGGGLPLASSLILVGDPSATVDLARAPWLRRLFR